MAGHVSNEIQLGRRIAFLTKEVQRLTEEIKKLKKENAELKEKLVRFAGQC